jgi:hypothetical protein
MICRIQTRPKFSEHDHQVRSVRNIRLICTTSNIGILVGEIVRCLKINNYHDKVAIIFQHLQIMMVALIRVSLHFLAYCKEHNEREQIEHDQCRCVYLLLRVKREPLSCFHDHHEDEEADN